MIARTFHVFSPEMLARVIRPSDIARFDLDMTAGSAALLENISQEATSGSVSLKEYNRTSIRGRPCISYNDFSTNLVLRSMTKVMKQCLGITTKSREAIVRGLIESMLDHCTTHLLRIDINSFYETIPISGIREALLSDTRFSTVTRSYLTAFFEEHCQSGTGVPRGVGVSALLAEMALIDFDRKARETEGVYRYFRFADDILILSFREQLDLPRIMASYLPKGMSLNNNKTRELLLIGEIEKGDLTSTFEYLGYGFNVRNPRRNGESRIVEVTISRKKITKIKTRIVLAARAYLRDKDDPLFLDRIRFLTSNIRVRRSDFAFSGMKAEVGSGIYFNYRLCGVYRSAAVTERVTRLSGSMADLKELDSFLFHITKGSRSELGRKIQLTLASSSRNRLVRYTFKAGFAEKVVVRFLPQRINQMKAVWSHV